MHFHASLQVPIDFLQNYIDIEISLILLVHVGNLWGFKESWILRQIDVFYKTCIFFYFLCCKRIRLAFTSNSVIMGLLWRGTNIHGWFHPTSVPLRPARYLNTALVSNTALVTVLTRQMVKFSSQFTNLYTSLMTDRDKLPCESPSETLMSLNVYKFVLVYMFYDWDRI